VHALADEMTRPAAVIAVRCRAAGYLVQPVPPRLPAPSPTADLQAAA
jgi:hypothetical protein